jgi:hypothetical protein
LGIGGGFLEGIPGGGDSLFGSADPFTSGVIDQSLPSSVRSICGVAGSGAAFARPAVLIHPRKSGRTRV